MRLPLIHCCDSSSSLAIDPLLLPLDDYAVSSVRGLHANLCPRLRQSSSWQSLSQYHLFLHREQRKGFGTITPQRSQVVIFPTGQMTAWNGCFAARTASDVLMSDSSIASTIISRALLRFAVTDAWLPVSFKGMRRESPEAVCSANEVPARTLTSCGVCAISNSILNITLGSSIELGFWVIVTKRLDTLAMRQFEGKCTKQCVAVKVFGCPRPAPMPSTSTHIAALVAWSIISSDKCDVSRMPSSVDHIRLIASRLRGYQLRRECMCAVTTASDAPPPPVNSDTDAIAPPFVIACQSETKAM